MPTFSRISLSLVVAFAIVFALLSFSPAVRSDYGDDSFIRLPINDSDGNGVDVCAGTAAPASCPVTCFRTDPVCGVDGETYWCGCADALCAGTRVAKLGFCEVGNGGSGSVSGQALLLVHIVWLILLGFCVLFGFL